MVEEAQETQENLEEVTVPKPEAMAEVAWSASDDKHDGRE